MVTGSAVASPDTVHLTRVSAPPPFPEPLHWVTVALVVLPIGAHTTVGWVPPPVPDPMHWLTVTPDVGVLAEMLLITVTLHVTLLPPPKATPLHWFTEVTSWLDVVTVVVQPEGGSTPASARHAVAVTVELVTPEEVEVLLIVMLQVTSNPAPVGMSGGLHWAAAGAVAAADAAGNPPTPPRISAVTAIPTTNIATTRRRTDPVLATPLGVVMRIALSTRIPQGPAAKLPGSAFYGRSVGEVDLAG